MSGNDVGSPVVHPISPSYNASRAEVQGRGGMNTRTPLKNHDPVNSRKGEIQGLMRARADKEMPSTDQHGMMTSDKNINSYSGPDPDYGRPSQADPEDADFNEQDNKILSEASDGSGDNDKSFSPEDAEPESQDNDAVQAANSGNLAGLLFQEWTRNYRARSVLDQRLLSCLRARRAEYSPEDAARYSNGGSSPPYLPIAAVKMRAAESAITELVMPVDDRPWGLETAPIPELSDELVQKVIYNSIQQAQNAMVQFAQAGNGSMSPEQFEATLKTVLDKLYLDTMKEENKEARLRADRMENVLETRLREGNYYEAMKQFIINLTTFPTAVLKGPVVRFKQKIVWGKDPSKPKVVNEPVLWWEAPSPFDCYPAPQSESAQFGSFFCRLRMTKPQMQNLIGLPGYDEQAIRFLLAQENIGILTGTIATDNVRRSIEGETGEVYKPDYFVDALHFNGAVQGKVLIMHGMSSEIDDPEKFYEISAILVDNTIIFCEINDDPLGHRPYWSTSFDEVPGSFWGNSVYELMADCQGMMNASCRALNANMGLASGPIMGVDISKLASGEDPKTIAPLSVIQLDGSRSGDPDLTKALVFFQAEDRITSHMQIINLFYEMSDDMTNIPRYMYGNQNQQGGAATSSGMSMLMGQSAKGIRNIVYNIDNKVIAKTLEAAYVWEMIYGTDEMTKGDCRVIARGSMEVMAREHLLSQAIQLLQLTSTPTYLNILGMKGQRALLEEIIDLLGFDKYDILPSEDELLQMIQQQASQPPQPSPNETLKAQTEIQRENIKAQTSLKRENMKIKAQQSNMLMKARLEIEKMGSHERQTGARLGATMFKNHADAMGKIAEQAAQTQQHDPLQNAQTTDPSADDQSAQSLDQNQGVQS